MTDDAGSPMTISRDRYLELCRRRWSGPALADAQRNWRAWDDLRDTLEPALRRFNRDSFFEDCEGTCHNASGTLSGFLWMLQESLQESASHLHPFLDFEEHHQKVFLRRGLRIYCGLMLDAINAPIPTPQGTQELPL